MGAVSGDVANAARRIQDGTATDADISLVSMYMPNPNAAELGALAQGNAPDGMALGGDNLTFATPEARTDERLAKVGSTVTDRDIEQEKDKVRAGRDPGLAAKAGGLSTTLDNTDFQRRAGAEYMMHAQPGESVEAFEKRQQEEANQKGGEKGGGMEMLASFFAGGMGLLALNNANDRIGGKLSSHDDRTVRNEGWMLAEGNPNNVQDFRNFGDKPLVLAGLEEGSTRAASLPGRGVGQQQTTQLQSSGGRERTLPA